MKKACWRIFICLLFGVLFSATCIAQEEAPTPTPEPVFQDEASSEFGPVVQSYLDYLESEQDVTDDRASRHEISRAYYIRNTNRIRALKRAIIRIASETGNDYVPELEAVALDEFKTIFETPPNIKTLKINTILNNTFRYLGAVRVGVVFHIFQRLDIYEKEELVQKQRQQEEQQKKEQKGEAKAVTVTIIEAVEETKQKKQPR